MIAILDYGLGNIRAFEQVYKEFRYDTQIVSSAKELRKAKKIILPGVGAFDWAMKKLNQSGLKELLNKKVLVEKTPVLGICIGLHLMAEKSEEGNCSGLGWIKGEVKKFDKKYIINKPKTPHMGWNTVKVKNKFELFNGINFDKGFYFIHSYYIEPLNKDNIMTTTEYGKVFVSGICSSNIYAVQFHPEKSHSNGIRLLKNFTEI